MSQILWGIVNLRSSNPMVKIRLVFFVARLAMKEIWITFLEREGTTVLLIFQFNSILNIQWEKFRAFCKTG